MALPGSASGLAPPAASEPVSSLLASVGNKSLLCKAEGLDNLGMVGQAGAGPAAPGVQRRERDGSYLPGRSLEGPRLWGL